MGRRAGTTNVVPVSSAFNCDVFVAHRQTDRQAGAEVSLKLGIALQGFCLSAGRHRGEGPIIILENPHRDFEPCLTFSSSKYPLMLWR